MSCGRAANWSDILKTRHYGTAEGGGGSRTSRSAVTFCHFLLLAPHSLRGWGVGGRSQKAGKRFDASHPPAQTARCQTFVSRCVASKSSFSFSFLLLLFVSVSACVYKYVCYGSDNDEKNKNTIWYRII